MFQIGRSSEPAIDFIVLDTNVSPPTGSLSPSSQQQSSNTIPSQSTISRFACRITVDRDPPYIARIYAAGFDSSKRIFLGVSFSIHFIKK
jgi:pellino